MVMKMLRTKQKARNEAEVVYIVALQIIMLINMEHFHRSFD